MKKSIKKLLPNSFKIKVHNALKNILIEQNEKREREIPKISFEEKHVENLKTCLNRKELLKLLPYNGVVAELGVNKGEFSEEILSVCKPTKLHLIDFWNSIKYPSVLKKTVESKFENEIKSGTVVIHHGKSLSFANQFEDGYFDWIYIDTSHAYEMTKAELELYADKIKVGGIIAGHDFIVGNWVKNIRYGVIEAVTEFCINNNWELLYLTLDNVESPSFALRKIS